MVALLRDVRHAVRQLVRAPGFAVPALLTLALGVGANTAIFTIFSHVILRPLPYPGSDRLVQLAQGGAEGSGEMSVTWNEFRFLADRAGTTAEFAATTPVGFTLSNGREAVRVNGLRVSRDYFTLLGVPPAHGRGFVAEEDAPGGAAAVVLSHGVWQRQFGGDPAILGQTVMLDGAPSTVVGIMPPGFEQESGVEAWSTLAQVGRTIGSGQNLALLGRLPPGMAPAQANQRLSPVFAAFREEFKSFLPREFTMELLPYQRLVVHDVSGPLTLLLGATGLVLLIACANVAGLFLGRALDRGRELAIRMALGASQRALLRQLLAESLVLGLAGGVLGLLVGVWGLHLLSGLLPADLPRVEGLHLDARSLGFTFGLSLLAGLLFGLIPAWRMSRMDPVGGLAEGSSRTTDGMGRGRLRDLVVVGEIALSLVLLTGAGLLGRTLLHLLRTDPGFDVGRVVSAEIWLTGSRPGADSSRVTTYYTELTRRLQVEPGVEAAAVVEAGLPLTRGGNLPVRLAGEADPQSTDYRTVTPDYFRVLGIPVLEGRALGDMDGATAERTVVVNRRFADRFLRGPGALGTMLTLGGDGGARYRVVGVVADVRSFVGLEPPPTVFISSAQTPPAFTRIFNSWFPIHVLIRTAGDPAGLGPALARVLREIDPLVPIGRISPMRDVLSQSLAFQRFLLVLLGGFAGLAALLAAIGIYGLMSHRVAQRRREFGIRLSLGARPTEVFRLVLARGVRLAAIGIALGLIGALNLTRLLAGELYGVEPLDPLTFLGVGAGIVVLSLVACAVPARRATRVDPMTALRAE